MEQKINKKNQPTNTAHEYSVARHNQDKYDDDDDVDNVEKKS